MCSNKKLISVIMSNYNTPVEYLKESIESILNQTYENFEFIIIDDASTDESLKYIESIKDDRIVVVKNTINLGLTKSLNVGLKKAKGEYIARMDSDDISLPTRFEEQVRYMEDNQDVIVCGTWFEKFGVENILRKPQIVDFEEYRCQLLFGNTPITLCHPSAMLRKTMLDKYRIIYDERCPKAQDYGMWVACSRYGRIAIIEQVLLKYRTHLKQISIDAASEQKACVNRISNLQLDELGVKNTKKTEYWKENKLQNVNEFKEYYLWIQEIKKANSIKNAYKHTTLNRYLFYKVERTIKSINKWNIFKLFLKGNIEVKSIIAYIVFNNLRESVRRKDE